MNIHFIELDDGKIYRKALYLMVKTHGFPVDFPNKTNPMTIGSPLDQLFQRLQLMGWRGWPHDTGRGAKVLCSQAPWGCSTATTALAAWFGGVTRCPTSNQSVVWKWHFESGIWCKMHGLQVYSMYSHADLSQILGSHKIDKKPSVTLPFLHILRHPGRPWQPYAAWLDMWEVNMLSAWVVFDRTFPDPSIEYWKLAEALTKTLLFFRCRSTWTAPMCTKNIFSGGFAVLVLPQGWGQKLMISTRAQVCGFNY